MAPFVQKAAAFALNDDQGHDQVLKMYEAYVRRRNKVLQIAREYGESPVRVIPPQGALYFFLDFRAFKRPSLQICEQILEDVGVGLVPGSAFGKQGEGFIRMSITASDEDVETGFRRILDWSSQQAGV